MFNNGIFNLVIISLTAFVFTACVMPFIMKIAYHMGALDIPRSDEGNRHIHKKTIPKLGGLGIFAGFLFGYMLFGVHSVQMNSILIGSFVIILLGIIDDIKEVPAKLQLLGQIIAASIVVFYGNILLNNVTAFGFYFDFGIWAYPITLFFIVGCINIINFIDGLDGLSSGISSIFFLTIGIIAFFQGRIGSLPIILTFIMLGSTLGFLLHNFNPAKIFAGQAGSMFMGFMIAIISLLGFKGAMLTSFLVPLIILGIPILDTLFAIIRRLLKKKAPFSADKEHTHHQILKMNFSQRTTVLIIYFINILFSLASIFYVLKDPYWGKIIYIILFVIIVWFTLHTGIISEKTSEKVKDLEKKVMRKNRKKEKKNKEKKK